jgi:transposase-like protein
MLSVAIAPQKLEAALAAGELACPDCCGRLSPWGFARSREVRLADEVRSLRPRRAVCGGCGATHVLAPAWTVSRRRDGAEVIGQALALACQGVGHRVIARRLGRAPGTVRGWLRAARRRAPSLRACATRWACALDPELGAVTPAGSELGDAVEAMMLAARAWTLRFGPGMGAWQLAVALTGGLLAGVPPPPR